MLWLLIPFEKMAAIVRYPHLNNTKYVSYTVIHYQSILQTKQASWKMQKQKMMEKEDYSYTHKIKGQIGDLHIQRKL